MLLKRPALFLSEVALKWLDGHGLGATLRMLQT